MASHEFGLLPRPEGSYEAYEPARYHCISVDDELIEPLLERLMAVPTFFHSTDRLERGLNYLGITLIPPSSLPAMKEVFQSAQTADFSQCQQLWQLLSLLDAAQAQGSYLIHYGI